MFCETGFHAVSVDAILEEAGVARITLYKNFGSKEELIVATLKREDRMFRQWLVSAVEAQSDHSQDRILGLSTLCTIVLRLKAIMAARLSVQVLSIPPPGHPVHCSAREHKEMIRSYLKLVTPGGGSPDKLCGEHS